MAVAGRSLGSKPNPIHGQLPSISLTGLKRVMRCAPEWRQTELQRSIYVACVGHVPANISYQIAWPMTPISIYAFVCMVRVLPLPLLMVKL